MPLGAEESPGPRQSARRRASGCQPAPPAGAADAPIDDATRVIVIDRGAPVGFVVDGIDGLLALPAESVEKDEAGAGARRS